MNEQMEQGQPIGELVTLQTKRPVLVPPFGMDFRTWFEYKKGLENKRSLVRSQVKRIAKNGRNESQGYRYAEAADIYDQINDIMHEARLGFAAEYLRDEVVFAKNGAPINKVYLLITWTDLENGYHEQQEIAGFGLDYGDKGIYKAYTGAAKYSLVLNFLIPTGDDPARGALDPENDKHDTTQGATGANQQQRGTNTGNRQGEAARARQDAKRNANNQPPGETAPPPNDPGEENTNAGTTGETEPKPKPGPITDEQVEKINELASILADFGGSTPELKKAGMKGTFSSIGVKLRLKDFSEKELKSLDEKQAEDALYCLDKWIATKEKKRLENEERLKPKEQTAEEVTPEQSQDETLQNSEEKGAE